MDPSLTAPSTCGGSYFAALWCELQQPEWLADVGVPLLATAVGLFLAYKLVGRQLTHDRQLRRADRRAAAVNQFGVEALDIIRSFWETSEEAWWLSPRWPRWADIYDAQRRVRAALGEQKPFPELVSTYRDVGWIWTACAQRRSEIEATGYEFTATDNSLAMDSVLTPIIKRCHDAAEKMVSWDGQGSLPDPALGPQTHVPLPATKSRAESHRRWLKFYADQYEGHLRRIADREKERRKGKQA